MERRLLCLFRQAHLLGTCISYESDEQNRKRASYGIDGLITTMDLPQIHKNVKDSCIR